MKHYMKKYIVLASALLCLTSCYEDFVKDFDYDSVYFSYQYDMRTIVVGEDESFDMTACLGGVIENARDRQVKVVADDGLLDTDLLAFAPEGFLVGEGDDASPAEPFTANDVFNGLTPPIGGLYLPSVQSEFQKTGLKALTPLPSDYYQLIGMDGLKIARGNHTGTFTVKATEKMLADDSVIAPKYAVGFRLLSADADSVLAGRNFAVIVVKCESQFYGNWYHGGSSVIKNADGTVFREEFYKFTIPQEEDKIFKLATSGLRSVVTDKYGNNKVGSLKLTFDKDNVITISSDVVKLVPDGRKSYANNAKLLQDRILYLNYSYEDEESGRTVEVSDSLVFRSRMRDFALEWQDEHPEYYK